MTGEGALPLGWVVEDNTLFVTSVQRADEKLHVTTHTGAVAKALRERLI
jgi:hypothetical protein